MNGIEWGVSLLAHGVFLVSFILYIRHQGNVTSNISAENAIDTVL